MFLQAEFTDASVRIVFINVKTVNFTHCRWTLTKQPIIKHILTKYTMYRHSQQNNVISQILVNLTTNLRTVTVILAENWGRTIARTYILWAINSTMCKHDAIHYTRSRQRTALLLIELQPQVTCTGFREICMGGFWDVWADTQTDRHTRWSQYLAPLLGVMWHCYISTSFC